MKNYTEVYQSLPMPALVLSEKGAYEFTNYLADNGISEFQGRVISENRSMIISCEIVEPFDVAWVWRNRREVNDWIRRVIEDINEDTIQ